MRLCVCVMLLFFFLSCNTNPITENHMPVNGSLELVYPKTTATFFIGDTVMIQYKINPLKCSGVYLKILLDSGKTSVDIASKFANSSAKTAYSDTMRWIIGNSEMSAVNYLDTNKFCCLKLIDYAEQTVFDKSAYFTIIRKK